MYLYLYRLIFILVNKEQSNQNSSITSIARQSSTDFAKPHCLNGLTMWAGFQRESYGHNILVLKTAVFCVISYHNFSEAQRSL